MFNTRYANTDPDIDLDKISSSIVYNLIGRYDSLLGPENNQKEIIFIDPGKRFFFSVLDRICWFSLSSVPGDYAGATDVLVPVIRAVYVSPVFRGRGLQEYILKDIISISEETGNSFAIYADPFEIKNDGRYNLCRVNEAIAALVEFGYEPTEDYITDLIKQRNRFLGLGLKNCVYADAAVTQPYQHFLYVPSSGPEAVKMLQNALEVHYEINPRYFNREENGAA